MSENAINVNSIIAQAEPFCDPDTGNFNINVPITEEDEKITWQEFPLLEEDAHAWVEKTLTQMLKRLTKGNETDKVIEVLRGAALERPRRKAGTQAPLKQDLKLSPLGKAVEYFATIGGLSAAPAELLSKLTSVARKKNLLDKASSFPVTEDQLGCQLSDLVPVLAGRSVKLERHGTARPRRWTIHPITQVTASKAAARQVDATPSDAGDVLVTEGTSSQTSSSGDADTSDTPVLLPLK